MEREDRDLVVVISGKLIRHLLKRNLEEVVEPVEELKIKAMC